MADRDEADEGFEEDDSADLPPSRLGTKEYWDDTYSRELRNYQESGDVGEIWFGEKTMEKMVIWIAKNGQLIKRNSGVLDIGCGNGMVLVLLAENGFTDLTGLDYSAEAIELAAAIAARAQPQIKYLTGDFLNLPPDPRVQRQFSLCLDKGTYDAVSLNPVDAVGCRSRYIVTLTSLLSDGGIFIITSCNWTQDELVHHFTEGGRFALVEVIPSPVFAFGGGQGSTTSSVVFRKQSSAAS